MDTSDASGPELPSLVDRVNLAFDALHPWDRGPYTTGEVVQWLSRRTASGQAPVDEADLAALRAGRKVGLPVGSLRALAEFFGAPAEYFVNDDHTARAVHCDLRRLVAARTLLAWMQP